MTGVAMEETEEEKLRCEVINRLIPQPAALLLAAETIEAAARAAAFWARGTARLQPLNVS